MIEMCRLKNVVIFMNVNVFNLKLWGNETRFSVQHEFCRCRPYFRCFLHQRKSKMKKIPQMKKSVFFLKMEKIVPIFLIGDAALFLAKIWPEV